MAPEPPTNGRGPALILIDHRIAPADRGAFPGVLEQPSRARRRDGAGHRGVAGGAADPELMVEWFMAESRAEHLRRHRRVPHADVQQEVQHFHRGTAPRRCATASPCGGKTAPEGSPSPQ